MTHIYNNTLIYIERKKQKNKKQKYGKYTIVGAVAAAAAASDCYTHSHTPNFTETNKIK